MVHPGIGFKLKDFNLIHNNNLSPIDKTIPNSFAKRLIDITGSLLGIIILSPLFLAIALTVKLTSKGPLIFNQKRIGNGGYPFNIYKFRSMVQDINMEFHKNYIAAVCNNKIGENNMKLFIENRNSSYTPIGKFLRRTSLDELPQLYNILKGEMSLVGPRPHPTYEVFNYRDCYFQRLMVKPGLTGLSKLFLRNSAIDYCKAMEIDIWYIQHWSILLDVKILIKTIYIVVFGKSVE